ncbi:MAG: primosomal protein N' [Oscillospiraceae bacterium]|nr:primosomal protein N' [Oscillospiraceae bacterium]
MNSGSVHAAKVVLSGADYGYDNEYTYRYPDLLNGTVRPGMRVLVPFGRGNTKRIGLVTKVYEKELTEDMGIKPIISLIDREPLINDELLDLVYWLKEHTFCTYFEAYRTIVPAGYTVVRRSVYTLSNHKPDITLTDEEDKFYQALTGAQSQKEFDSILDCTDSPEKEALIDSLLDKGILEEVDEFKRRVGDETVRMIRLSPDYMNRSGGKPFTPKQQLIVDFLEENSSASIKELCYILSVTQTIITSMLKKGILEEYRYESLRTPKSITEQKLSLDSVVLSDEQREVYEGISKLLDEGKPAGALLHGVTGSGKTAVFIKLIERTIKSGKGCILLLPEISLTPQMVSKFCTYFGDTVAVVHSSLSLGQRMDEFKRISRGDAKIVIGTRSAVFAPMPNIGLIIMDEEGESSYKSDASPRYHARDVAIKRCGNHNALLLMASATPSLESYYYAKNSRYHLFELNHRYSGAKLPQVVVADMLLEAEEGNTSIFCADMVRRISEETKKGKQTILLLNRRGFNTTATCLDCKSSVKCPHCLVPLTYHKSSGKLICHYCGYYATFNGRCPECGSDRVRLTGLGTQRLEEELTNAFPDARILRMDADTTYSRYAYEEKFSDFEAGKYDIMLGTQMIAKGLDFPNVTTVGVISLDNSLNAGDYRSYERTFSLLTQVCGRGGRGDSEAVAYIQTFFPDHHIIKLASEQDYKGFYEQEVSLRKELIYPPFCDICTVSFSSTIESDARRAANEFVSMMKKNLEAVDKKFPLRVLGPVKSGYGRIGGKYRYALTIKCRLSNAFRAYMAELLKETYKNKSFSNVRVYADINGD